MEDEVTFPVCPQYGKCPGEGPGENETPKIRMNQNQKPGNQTKKRTHANASCDQTSQLTGTTQHDERLEACGISGHIYTHMRKEADLKTKQYRAMTPRIPCLKMDANCYQYELKTKGILVGDKLLTHAHQFLRLAASCVPGNQKKTVRINPSISVIEGSNFDVWDTLEGHTILLPSTYDKDLIDGSMDGHMCTVALPSTGVLLIGICHGSAIDNNPIGNPGPVEDGLLPYPWNDGKDCRIFQRMFVVSSFASAQSEHGSVGTWEWMKTRCNVDYPRSTLRPGTWLPTLSGPITTILLDPSAWEEQAPTEKKAYLASSVARASRGKALYDMIECALRNGNRHANAVLHALRFCKRFSPVTRVQTYEMCVFTLEEICTRFKESSL